MLTLFGAVNMLAQLETEEDFGYYSQLTLYSFHNEVKPKVNEAIWKFEFDCEEPQLFDNIDLPLVKYQRDTYWYRPHYTDQNGERLLPIYSKRVTRAAIESDHGIPKIDVIVPVDPKVFDMPHWWASIGHHVDKQKYAPKWICEHYVTGRFGNKVRYTYIPVLIEAEQRDALVKTQGIIDQLVDACYKDIDGVRFNLF